MIAKSEHMDVLIVGAGLSGIGAAFHLQQKCPGKSYLILEGRDCIGGTWDLFRYPGRCSASRQAAPMPDSPAPTIRTSTCMQAG